VGLQVKPQLLQVAAAQLAAAVAVAVAAAAAAAAAAAGSKAVVRVVKVDSRLLA
jgi:hypothetical protein